MKYSTELADAIIAQYATGKQTVDDLRKAVGISRVTFYTWKDKRPGFARRLADVEAARLESLGQMAMSGLALLIQKHEYEETKVEYTEGKDGQPRIKSKVITKKVIMPNAAAVIFVLTNRDPENWKHRQALSLSGPAGEEVGFDITLKI